MRGQLLEAIGQPEMRSSPLLPTSPQGCCWLGQVNGRLPMAVKV
jgi:hypothetical protein